MSDNLPNYPHLVKKIKASFLWRLTKGGKVVSEWTADFTKEPGSVTLGKPSGKPSCTITIADDDFMKIAMGETNPQKLFMLGKIKISGNIMLAQKLQTFLNEFDLKKVFNDFGMVNCMRNIIVVILHTKLHYTIYHIIYNFIYFISYTLTLIVSYDVPYFIPYHVFYNILYRTTMYHSLYYTIS